MKCPVKGTTTKLLNVRGKVIVSKSRISFSSSNDLVGRDFATRKYMLDNSSPRGRIQNGAQ